jgi:hypothetical protein
MPALFSFGFKAGLLSVKDGPCYNFFIRAPTTPIKITSKTHFNFLIIFICFYYTTSTSSARAKTGLVFNKVGSYRILWLRALHAFRTAIWQIAGNISPLQNPVE